MAQYSDHAHASLEDAQNATLRPGAALAAARVARKISVEDVARLLKLSVAKVMAIEADDHSGFPSPVYARGFVRTYARLLNVDIEPMMPAKAAAPAVKMDERLMHHVEGEPIETPRRSAMPAMIAASLLLLAGLAYYEFVVNPPPGSFEIAAAGTTQTPPAAESGDTDAAAPAPHVSVPSAAPRVPAITPAAEPPRTATVMMDGLQLKKSVDPTSGVNEKGLHFMFNGESWVEVRDRGGKVVFSRINAPGSERVVQGEPPFSLVIGGASGVQLSYNGTPVNLASYVTEDVARLRLE